MLTGSACFCTGACRVPPYRCWGQPITWDNYPEWESGKITVTIPDLAPEGKYGVEAYCTNCGYRWTYYQYKGKKVPLNFDCPNCECYSGKSK